METRAECGWSSAAEHRHRLIQSETRQGCDGDQTASFDWTEAGHPTVENEMLLSIEKSATVTLVV